MTMMMKLVGNLKEAVVIQMKKQILMMRMMAYHIMMMRTMI